MIQGQEPLTREQLAERIRDQMAAVRQAVQDEAAARQGSPPTAPRPDVTVMTVPQDPNRIPDIPPRVADTAMLFFVTMFAIIVFTPIARAIGRWIDRRAQAPARPSAQVTSQLTQLTQSVDAIAIEVERISEGQRFTTKLLSDLQARRGTMLPSETAGSRTAE